MDTQPTVPIPTSHREADQLIAELASQKREIERTQARLNEKVARITAAATDKVGRLEHEIEVRVRALYTYAQREREFLLQGDKKSVSVPSGTFGWRLMPSRVELLKSDKEVIADLEKKGLHDYIRIKKEVSKSAILEDPDAETTLKAKGVRCIRVSGGVDRFYVKPLEVSVYLMLPPE